MSALPPLSPQDENIVLALILNDNDIFAASDTTALTPIKLLALSTRPDIAGYLAAYRRLTLTGIERQALATLARLLNPQPNPTPQTELQNIEARRAATAILRHIRAGATIPRPAPRAPNPPAPQPANDHTTPQPHQPRTPVSARQPSTNPTDTAPQNLVPPEPNAAPLRTANRLPSPEPLDIASHSPATFLPLLEPRPTRNLPSFAHEATARDPPLVPT